MRVVMFYHSLASCWNHGNAHFLRGVASELQARGHEVAIYEPADGWSRGHLVAEYGEHAPGAFTQAYPGLTSTLYDRLDLDAALDRADLVLVHEWNEPGLIARIGAHRGDFVRLFHDTHHRAVSDPAAAFDVRNYDGVLAFGQVLRDIYRERGWARQAWIWHEAADTRVFRPRAASAPEGDLVWIGNWGDGERTAELHEFLIDPVRELGLKARVYGVRYPEEARRDLAEAGIEYAGWVPNHRVPAVFTRYTMTVHVPRGYYARILPGIPTIRVFEALACGVPLVSAPWDDREHLFTPGEDFLVARDGQEMKLHLQALREDERLRRRLAEHGLRTIRARHTCAHRVDELMSICRGIGLSCAAASEVTA